MKFIVSVAYLYADNIESKAIKINKLPINKKMYKSTGNINSSYELYDEIY